MSLTSSQITNSQCYTYAADVVSGNITACIKVRRACQRFLDELEYMHDDDYPWIFDIDKAYRPIRFIEKFLVPSKGDYKRMELMPWQHFVEANVYGWINKKTRLRRFREALVVVGSGNGKSTLVVGNAAYAASKDGERGAEVYTLANSKEQARIVFDECKTQIRNSPTLDRNFRVTRDGIYYDKNNSKIQPLATDSRNLDGRNVHLAIFDEIQEYKDYRLINVIDKKKKKRRQPLTLYITTLGPVIDGPLMDFYQIGSDILSGSGIIDDIVSDRMFIFIAEIDENDDPDDTTCWVKANPSIGQLLKMEDLVAEWERCKLVPAQRSDFINKQLNVFTSVDELSFLDNETILGNKNTIDVETLLGRDCHGGFDLAETQDFTSACLEFELDDGSFFVMSHSWVPQRKIDENHEKLNWQELINTGLLSVVPGNYVNFQFIYDWFAEKRELYNIVSIGFDSAKAYVLVNEMKSAGFVLSEVRQGEFTLTAPMDHMREVFLDGKMIHNNNKLYNWYLSNVKLTKRGHNATYLPTKQSKYRKIDGFAAHLNAHTEWLRRRQTDIPSDSTVAWVLKLEA